MHILLTQLYPGVCENILGVSGGLAQNEHPQFPAKKLKKSHKIKTHILAPIIEWTCATTFTPVPKTK